MDRPIQFSLKGLMLVVTAVAVCAAIVSASGYAVALVMALDVVAGIASVAWVLSAARMTDDLPGAAWLTPIAALLPPLLIFVTTCLVIAYSPLGRM
jgi:hypothetical protein